MQNSLTVTLRHEQGKGVARKLRAAGKVPGVVYGSGAEPRPVVLDGKMFELLVRAGGHHGLIDLSFEGGAEPIKALVREIQVHPVSRAVEHVDLQQVSMRERIRIEVPIVLVGKPEGVKTHGGILEHNLRNVEVECLPGDIPEQIEIDVSQLNIGQALHVSDLSIPKVVILAHAETAIATVSLPAAERAHEEAAATAVTEAGAPAEGEAGAKAAAPGDKAAAEKGGGKDAKEGKEAKGGGKDAKEGKESKGGKG
jgi:large subunit ribosomal protein L25